MALPSPEYWRERSAARMDSYIRDSDQTLRIIGRAHKQAQADIQASIDRIYAKVGKAYQLGPEEVQRLLSQPCGRAEYEQLLQQISKIKSAALRRPLEARAASGAYAYRVSRLEALRDNVRAQTARLADVELDATTAGLTRTINGAYQMSMFDLQRGTGHGFAFTQLNGQAVAEILHNPWSGASFSRRIWANQDLLADVISRDITAAFMTGKSNKQMAAELADRMGVSYRNAERLVRTETNYMANAAEMRSYTEAGIDKYEYMATLDLRTSEVCQDLDGMIFAVKLAKPGENMPPMHPHCRSTTVAALNRENEAELERRARDPKTGRTVLVPRSMKYAEWRASLADVPAPKPRKGAALVQPTPPGPPAPVWESWAKKTAPAAPVDDLKATNPLYKTGREYKINCQRCVPAYEMRRRGYEVTAKPRIMTGEDETAKNWRRVFEGATWQQCPAGSGIRQVKEAMKAYGDGARAEVYVTWKGGKSAHVFIAEQYGNNTTFSDPQTGELGVDYYFDSAQKGSTEVCRIDNLVPSNLIINCCEVK